MVTGLRNYGFAPVTRLIWIMAYTAEGVKGYWQYDWSYWIYFNGRISKYTINLGRFESFYAKPGIRFRRETDISLIESFYTCKPRVYKQNLKTLFRNMSPLNNSLRYDDIDIMSMHRFNLYSKLF